MPLQLLFILSRLHYNVLITKPEGVMGMVTETKVRYFLTLAEELHFGRAAKRLYISQQGLSYQIASLEKDLGVQLFIRDAKCIRLTDAGKKFAELFACLEHDIQRILKQYQGQSGDTLAVAYFENMDIGPMLFEIRDHLQRTRSDLKMQILSIRSFSAIFQAFASGDLDAAILPMSVDLPDGFASATLCLDPTYALFGADFPNAQALCALDDVEKGIILAGPDHNCIYRRMDDFFQNRPEVQMHSEPGMSCGAELILIKSGMAMGFGGEHSILYRDGSLLRFPLGDAIPLSIIWRKRYRHPCLTELTRMLKEKLQV